MQILLVEDQAHSAAAIHSGLQQSAIAYDVHHCATLASAIEALETRSFDAALIDLGLPHASGTDVVVAIKAVSPSMPLVILTDEDFDSLGEALLLSGIQDFLLKSEVSIARIDQSLRMAVEHQRYEEELRRGAVFDEPTGLANRAELNETMVRVLSRARRRSALVAILAIGLHNSGRINNGHGHPEGNIVLTKSATRLAQAVRLGDCAARVGGDEFIVVLDSISDPEMAIAIASRIGAKLRQPIFHNGHEYPISASIGISIYPDHAENRFGLVGLADQARYATNQNGNGAVRMHKPCPDKSSATARPALSGESINGGRLESTSSSARDFRLSRREERR